MGALLKSLRSLGGLLVALFGQTNLLGWSVAALIPAAFIAIWLTVLNYVFGYLTAYIAAAASSGTIFGISGIPAGGLWLLQQAIPVQLMFDLTLTLLIFRITAAQLLVVAIAASRYLKGK